MASVPHALLAHTTTHRTICRRLLNGLQVLIAKGRPRHLQRRSALQGNYAPVKDEVFSASCEVVKGAIPLELDGMFLRNGSNPVQQVYAGYHCERPHRKLLRVLHVTVFCVARARSCGRSISMHASVGMRKAGC